MAYIVCWLDSEEAKIFEFTNQGINKVDLKIKAEEKTANKSGDHHHHDSSAFYQRVAETMKSCTEALIVGPGMAKKHFKGFLENKNQNLLKRVVSFENMDHPTDKQIVAEARKFFKAHDLFEGL